MRTSSTNCSNPKDVEEYGCGKTKDLVVAGIGSGGKKRATNFDSIEDDIICRCWRILTNDAKTGTNQTSDAFWQRLFVKFTTLMMEEHKRSQAQINEHRSWGGLRSRWRRCIQKECMLFGLVFRCVRATEISVWQEEDYIKEAMTRYRAMNGKTGSLLF